MTTARRPGAHARRIVAPDLLASPDFASPAWRYLPLWKFESLLARRAVWFSRLGALSDQYEGTIPPPTRRTLQARSEKWLPVFPAPEHQRQIRAWEDDNERNGRAMYAVSCWFLGEGESAEMWQEYVPGGHGVVVQSSCEAIAQSLALQPEYSQIRRVRYVNFAAEDMGTYLGNQAIERAFLKSLRYQGERELRVATMNLVAPGCLNPDGTPPTPLQLSGPGMFDPSRPGLYVSARLSTLIQSVRVSPGSPSSFLESVRRLVSPAGLRWSVGRSALD